MAAINDIRRSGFVAVTGDFLIKRFHKKVWINPIGSVKTQLDQWLSALLGHTLAFIGFCADTD